MYDLSVFKLLGLVLWHRVWSSLVSVLCALERKNILLMLDGVFYKCQLVELVDSVFQIFYTFIYFLSTCSITWERDTEISNYNYLSFLFAVLSVLLHIFWSSIIRHLNMYDYMFSWWIKFFIRMKWSTWSLITFFALKSTAV